VIRAVTALWLALDLGPAIAENTPPAVPDPQKLSADWWTYFEPTEPLGEQARNQRVTGRECCCSDLVAVAEPGERLARIQACC